MINDIGIRIKRRREALEMSQQELAEKVGFKTASAVNKIELGLRDINQTKIILFAKALGTTPSYLIGWDDEKEKRAIITSLAQRMKEAMKLRNISQSEIVKRTGIGKSSISTYLSGEYEPKQRNIYKICEVLSVNEAWLMGYDVPMERHPMQLKNFTVTTDMEFKDIIKNRRKELDLTLEEIGNAVGVAKATVLRWESGEIQNIRRDKIVSLANVLRLPVGVLMGWDDEETFNLKNTTVTTDTVLLPVISNIAAGYDEIDIEDWSKETVEVPVSYLKGRSSNEFIVLKIYGDSMYPEYHNGDKVVILKQAALPRSGAIGAVLNNGETATLKRVEFFDNKIKLIPLNPTYPPKTITGPDCEQVHIIGIPKILIREIEE